jgi:hypothetical protein
MLTYADVILQVRHMFREMAVRTGSGGASGGSDRIDIDCFCSVLQEHELDRPAGTCVLVLLYMCSRTTIHTVYVVQRAASAPTRPTSRHMPARVGITCLQVSSVLLYMFSRTTIYVFPHMPSTILRSHQRDFEAP